MSLTFPNESPEYREARSELLARERDLRAQIERVAQQRRALPPGGVVPHDYEFTATDGSPARLSSLFGEHRTLLIYSFMHWPDADRPCPACTSLMDGWNGHIDQLAQRVAFAAVSSGTPQQLGTLAAEREWRIPIYSAVDTDYQRDYFGEASDGEQHTFMNVFHGADGEIRHRWGSELERDPAGGHTRHLDLTWPLWNLLDLTPEGRGDFFPRVFDD